jgi:hypothetical protein
MYYFEETINFNKENGPVIVNIVREGKTLGKFIISMFDGNTWTNLGNGDISDSIPDIYITPYQGVELDKKVMLINANYLPAGNTKNMVTYSFSQKDVLLKETTIPKKASGVNACYSVITFVMA